MVTLQPDLRAEAGRRAASMTLIATSLFGLDGCAVVKGIFNVGVGVGVVIVVTILALAGGVAALMTRQ